MKNKKCGKKVKLQKINAITVFRAGHQALTEIDGLRSMAVRGMFINYLIFFAASKPLNMRSQDFANTTTELLNKGKMPPEVFSFLASVGYPEWQPGQILTDDFSPFDILLGSG